jgi:hypothetical protein
VIRRIPTGSVCGEENASLKFRICFLLLSSLCTQLKMASNAAPVVTFQQDVGDYERLSKRIHSLGVGYFENAWSLG